MRTSFEHERAEWKAQAARSLQSSKLTRSLGRSRSQSVGRARAQLKDIGGVGFLATKTLLGNQLSAPTVHARTPSDSTQTRSGTSHAYTSSSGGCSATRSRAALRAATGLCVSGDKVSPQDERNDGFTRIDSRGKGVRTETAAPSAEVRSTPSPQVANNSVPRQVVLSTGAPALIMRARIPPPSPLPRHLLPSPVTCPHAIACRHMRRCIHMRLFRHIRSVPLHSTPPLFIPGDRTRPLLRTHLHHGQSRRNRRNPDLHCWIPGKRVVWARMHTHLLLHRAAASAVASRWPLPMHYHMGYGGETARIVDLKKAKTILEGPLRHYTLLSPTWC